MTQLEFIGLTLWRDNHKNYWYEIHGGKHGGHFLFLGPEPSEEETKKIAKTAYYGTIQLKHLYTNRGDAEDVKRVHINQIVIFREAETWIKSASKTSVRLMVLFLGLYAAVFTALQPHESTTWAWTSALAVILWGHIGFRHRKGRKPKY